MTQDEIIEMARQSGLPKAIIEMTPIAFETFAMLVAQHEREACAKVCDLALFQCQETMNELDATEHIAQCIVQGAMNQAVKLSNAIRARGQA